MKRKITAILMFDIILGLLFFCVLVARNGKGVAVSSVEMRAASQVSINEATKMELESLNVEEGKQIALTFDDGPHPSYTEKLLDGLKERGVVVTFFVTGEHAKLHPDIIKRAYEEGHLIGNHTYSHLQLRKNNLEEFKQELVETSEIIEGITGEEVLYVRPPYGSWEKSIEKELNMFPVMWTIDPLDWCSKSVDSIVNRIVGSVKENSIILMHDYFGTSVTAALRAVDELMEEGYQFVTVDEILFD